MSKQCESGRSMVEMLAVLAIVGIITVGGMTGYTTALRKNQSNAILDLVAKISIYAQTHAKKVVVNTTDHRIGDVGLYINDYPCLNNVLGYTNGKVWVEFKTTDSVCQKIKDLSAGVWGNTWNATTNTYTPTSEY